MMYIYIYIYMYVIVFGDRHRMEFFYVDAMFEVNKCQNASPRSENEDKLPDIIIFLSDRQVTRLREKLYKNLWKPL